MVAAGLSSPATSPTKGKEESLRLLFFDVNQSAFRPIFALHPCIFVDCPPTPPMLLVATDNRYRPIHASHSQPTLLHVAFITIHPHFWHLSASYQLSSTPRSTVQRSPHCGHSIIRCKPIVSPPYITHPKHRASQKPSYGCGLPASSNGIIAVPRSSLAAHPRSTIMYFEFLWKSHLNSNGCFAKFSGIYSFLCKCFPILRKYALYFCSFSVIASPP